MSDVIPAFPLSWPPGWRRASTRERAKFGKQVAQYRDVVENGVSRRVHSCNSKADLSISEGTQRVLEELGRMGVSSWTVIISSNLALRNDGLPRSGQRAPDDPGVAVYWSKSKDQRCIAVDRYDRVQDNLAAIAATLDAMRAIERHGGAAILDRAFQGFTALPAPEQWFTILGVSATATPQQIEDAYRRLAMKHHPDRNPDDPNAPREMARINGAREQGLQRSI